jgi:hypothetical protein
MVLYFVEHVRVSMEMVFFFFNKESILFHSKKSAIQGDQKSNHPKGRKRQRQE